jgi:hypothetical protein
MLPLRHAGRTAAVARRPRAAGVQIAARTAEQLFVTLGELKSGAAKAASGHVGIRGGDAEGSRPIPPQRPASPEPRPGPARCVRLRRRERNRDALDAQAQVEAMSLYNHVTNKDDLLDGMIDLVFSEIELPSTENGWKKAMR